jgi:hypothetical protein
MGRGPFGFAQGRLFDYVAASLREAATPLRMTFFSDALSKRSADGAPFSGDEAEVRKWSGNGLRRAS